MGAAEERKLNESSTALSKFSFGLGMLSLNVETAAADLHSFLPFSNIT